MENEISQISNNKKGKNIIIIILSLLLALSLAAVVYLYLNKEECNLETNKEVDQTEENEEITYDDITISSDNDSTLSTSINYSVSNEVLGIVAVDNNGDAYLLNVAVESDEIGSKIGESTQYEMSIPGTMGTTYDGYKLDASNIVSAYIFEWGNGGITYDIVLIDKDNMASILRLTSVSPADYKIAEAVYYNNVKSNIISAVAKTGSSYNLIDLDGNRYEVN